MALSVTFRKNNQADRSKKTEYKVYSVIGEEAFDAYSAMREYTECLRKHRFGDNDYLFPFISGSTIHLKNSSYNFILSVVKNLSLKLGLHGGRNGEFTTHSFRRGGAQYRFMHAKRKWSLSAIKWWGGWANGEDPGTLMKYLIDEYSSLESSFSDMMAPRPILHSYRADEQTDVEWSSRMNEINAIITQHKTAQKTFTDGMQFLVIV
jgi:hypothetical protein